jgi:hypothetical protein
MIRKVMLTLFNAMKQDTTGCLPIIYSLILKILSRNLLHKIKLMQINKT